MTLRFVKIGDHHRHFHDVVNNIVYILSSCSSVSVLCTTSLAEESLVEIGRRVEIDSYSNTTSTNIQKLRKFDHGELEVVNIKRLNTDHVYALYSWPLDWKSVKHLVEKGSAQYKELTDKLFTSYCLFSWDINKDLTKPFVRTFLSVLLQQESERSNEELCEKALRISSC